MKKIENVETLVQRIEAKCTTNSTGCLVYPTNNSDGYARVTIPCNWTPSGVTTVRPSRVLYEFYVGPIPAGLELDHVKARGCSSTACCNPAHLEPVTGKINKLRGTSPAAANAVKTHCPQGHEYDEANTYINLRGARLCRACHKQKKADQRRADGAGLPSAVREACPQEHPYDEVNTAYSTTGWRICKTCRRDRDRVRARARRVKER